MKRFALFFSLFMLCLVVKANPVSRSQALKEAKSFLATKGVEMNTSEAAYRAPRKANAQESESSYYYIFNVGNDEGFVIVSGDDRTEQILGYSDSGSFDEENMPEPLKEWLDGYAKEMESIIEVDANEYESLSPRRAQEKTKKSIAPLTTSKWGSGYPYSSKTPIRSTTGLHSGLGCATVALSQLLYYYKDFNVKTTTSSISSIPAGTKLDWENMLDEYIELPSINYNTTQLNAVSNFMYYCALALGVNFSNGSASVTKHIPTLKNYFGFDTSLTYVNREYYSVEEWENVLYNELINDRPILYNGFFKNPDYVGHSFIVDGYDNSGLFHVNWGWNGMYNGFFRISVLNRYNPGCISSINPTEHSYVLSQSALLYAVPKSIGCVNNSNHLLSAKLTSLQSSTLTYVFRNESGLDGKYLYGIGCVINGDLVPIKSYNDTFISLNNSSNQTVSFSLSINDFANLNIAKGEYVIVPIFKTEDDKKWRVCQYNKDIYAKAFYGSNNVLTLSMFPPSSFNSKDPIVYVSNFDIQGNNLVNKKHCISTTVNSNSQSFTGNAYLFASTTSSKDLYASSELYLGRNDEITIDFSFTPKVAGDYTIWIATDTEGKNVIGTTKLSIVNKSEPSLDISKKNFGINKNYAGFIDGKRSIWGNEFDVTVTGLKNNGSSTISTTFTIWLREYDSVNAASFNYSRYSQKGDNAWWKVVNLIIPPGETRSIPIKFENLKLNSRYDIRVEYNSQATGSNSKIIDILPMVFLPAVTTWKADGTSTSVAPTSTVTIGSDVVAVDITDATDVKTITPNSNPNILYYLGANQTMPTGLTNKNVVKGDVAEKITLVDNKNFFVPKRFTAKSINFTTQPKKGVSRGNNNNWTTIALPFEVTSVKNTTDNEIIDWFHSDTDTGKNFWIRKFDRLETSDNTVIFENAEKMLAYEPYIMNVPDDYWGKKWDLRNKNITFYGENAVLHNEANIGTNSSYYNFVGTTLTKNVDNGWLLNDAGDTFKYVISGMKGTSTIVSPFHAYFMLTSDFYDGSSANSAKSSLRIKFDGDEDSTTGIMAPFAADEKVVDIYNLNGVKVASKNLKNGSVDMSDLPKGIYVVNGKKFIQY